MKTKHIYCLVSSSTVFAYVRATNRDKAIARVRKSKKFYKKRQWSCCGSSEDNDFPRDIVKKVDLVA